MEWAEAGCLAAEGAGGASAAVADWGEAEGGGTGNRRPVCLKGFESDGKRRPMRHRLWSRNARR